MRLKRNGVTFRSARWRSGERTFFVVSVVVRRTRLDLRATSRRLWGEPQLLLLHRSSRRESNQTTSVVVSEMSEADTTTQASTTHTIKIARTDASFHVKKRPRQQGEGEATRRVQGGGRRGANEMEYAPSQLIRSGERKRKRSEQAQRRPPGGERRRDRQDSVEYFELTCRSLSRLAVR